MAGSTITYTINMARTPGAIEKGVNTLPFDFNSGTAKTGTLSDMVLLGKIPNGALITTKKITFGVSTAAATHWALILLGVDADGTFTTIATLMPSLTASTALAQFTDHRPVKLSLSDDRAIQYAILALNCTTGASATVSTSFYGSVDYLTDGRTV